MGGSSYPRDTQNNKKHAGLIINCYYSFQEEGSKEKKINGRRLIAIGHMSDSGDLNIFKSINTEQRILTVHQLSRKVLTSQTRCEGFK